MMKLFTLPKNLICALSGLMLLFSAEVSQAQCADDNTYYMDVTTTGDGDFANAPCVYGGEYVTASVCAGVDYEITTCGGSTWDTQITLFDAVSNVLDYDDDGCGISGGSSYIYWTATYTGVLYISVDLYDCQSNATCASLTVTQFGECSTECSNDNALYNVNATPSSVGVPVTVNQMYGGEYVNVTVCNGANYTFSACGASYDTQLSLYTPGGSLLAYDDDGCGTFAGPSQINWTSNMSGTVRLLLDQYPCVSNTTNTTVQITQNTACPSSCIFTDAFAEYNSCFGDQEWVDFYPYFTGTCTASYLYLYTTELGWETIDLTLDDIDSGDPVGILLGVDNTTYLYYFELSNGTTSADYTYNTSLCTTVGCSFTSADYVYMGCNGTSESVVFFPEYTGGCTVEGMYTYTTAGGWQYVDLSAQGYTSGDAVGMFLTADNTLYTYTFVLSDGTESQEYFYMTGTCDVVLCNVTDVQAFENGCVGTYENVDFYVYFTGACTVEVANFYTAANGWESVTLTGGPFSSGDAIGLDLLLDNTIYDYYFTLSDGSTSDTYTYITGNCDNQTLCSNLNINYIEGECLNEVPTGFIVPTYTGSCLVEGIYTSVGGAPYEYLDLSAYAFSSGDAIELFFNIPNADYQVYYVLSDGSVSGVTFFTTPSCLSGTLICDCTGTQIPIEATAWLGDGSLDDGTYFWNQDPSLPVDFNCATWGFDCGDEIPAGYFPYDPYGVCSGAIPPANGCVDEFCYSVDVDVMTDCYPEEVTAYVLNAAGDLVFVASGADFIIEGDVLYTFNMCLPAGCYTYVIEDEFGDGLAGADCSSIGYTGIYDYNVPGYVVFANGDEYGLVFSGEFCVGPQTVCDNLSMNVFDAPCYPNSQGVLMPTISYTFDFSGPCTVQSIFYSENGGEFVEVDVSANLWGSGDEGMLYYLQPNADYTIYYTTNDGASSYLYDFSTTDCSNEITICDCNGTQLTSGVLSWLGDGFADNGFYQWAGEDVNFNCSTWGYDCGDIDGAPNVDPYNVCDGQLPPFNGCITTTEILGCTDPNAINYNPQATINDGSCIYNLQVGCMDVAACNYNDLAIVDDGSCEYVSCVGCTDPTASNYDPTATQDDGSCIYIDIEGCTDENALNYDPVATTDDGSCVYNCVWPSVSYDSHCSQGNLTSFFIDVDLTALGNGAPYTITNSYNNQQQVMSLTGSVTMGPFPNNVQVVVQVTSNVIDCFLTSQPMTENCSVAGVYGCTDPTALNYNPDATIDDGSCIYIGVEELEVSYFTIYPNPAREKVVLTNKGNVPTAAIRILDNTGRLIQSEQLIIAEGNSHQLDVSQLAQGNYVIEILTDRNVEHHTVIIQK